MERGLPPPPGVDPPETIPGTELAWEAFWQLTTDRQLGMGVGPIPWTAIDRWAGRHAVADPDDFDELVELITAMDHTYLDHVEREMERRRKARPGSGRGGG